MEKEFIKNKGKRPEEMMDAVDLSLAEKCTAPKASNKTALKVMAYCSNCGKKNAGGRYCTECGKKLVIGYELENIGGKVIFTCDAKEYELKSHPYEPCLYLYRNNEMVKILHNAFEVYDLVKKFESGETVSAPDSKQYDKEDFCKVLSAALCNERYEMNWTFAAKLVK